MVYITVVTLVSINVVAVHLDPQAGAVSRIRRRIFVRRKSAEWLAVFDDVLDLWSKNAQVGIYPTLCQLANIHLSASAASVPVESMFSTAGLVANSKRSSISAERLHRV